MVVLPALEAPWTTKMLTGPRVPKGTRRLPSPTAISYGRCQQCSWDSSHYAFSVGAAGFAPLCARLEAAEVFIWQDNHSEGESFYFLDPDGHRLEIHVGDLASRLAHCRASPYPGMQFFSEEPS